MSGHKVLIDTNVIIELEDHKEVSPIFARFLQLCTQHGVRVFVHERAVADIDRDKNAERRAVTRSKIRKFEALNGIKSPPLDELAARFGTINKPNDEVDVALLHALDLGAVDFLVSQDQGIHTRARRKDVGLADRVLVVADALQWLETTFEALPVKLPLIEEVPAHAISPADEIFESLRDGYADFDGWWKSKCVGQHRPCWVVTINNELAGLIVRKQEDHAEAQTKYVGDKILKICTFKVKPEFRGEKLGELLLKQALWFAQKNQFDLVYVTTFENQTSLIRVLEYFGFENTKKNERGELVFEKPLPRTILSATDDDDVFDLARKNYPRFVARPPAEAFCIPIQGRYHDTLFPELALPDQPDFFGTAGTVGGARTPGNTIRKVYLCRAKSQAVGPGSIILFYRSNSPGYWISQSITSVGVVERVLHAHSVEDLVRLTAKRSAYTTEQLSEFFKISKSAVKVIDFLLMGHFDPAIPLDQLLKDGVFRGWPPQSITRLDEQRFAKVRGQMNFGFGV
ncbi:ribosomal protein S18 acetylase RimI-like enzyme [Bradyrhizobium sp. USDA 4501]